MANGGYLVQPHVVDRMLDSDGNIVKTTDTSYKRQVISEDVSKRMTAILQKNATSESGKNGYVAGYRVAGKTGTSEKVALYYQDLAEGNDRGMQYVVSYGGFAPADDPQYALLVFYDEPQIGGASGGSQAGPIFAAIMEEILPYLGVSRSTRRKSMRTSRRRRRTSSAARFPRRSRSRLHVSIADVV